MEWESNPDAAWRDFILPAAEDAGWVEDGKNISSDIKLSNRELFGLIILAQALSDGDASWSVGYDSTDPEPNDGYVTDGTKKLGVEHKIIAQQEKTDVLETMLNRYEKFRDKGPDYGKDKVFIIQPNKSTLGAIKVSDLSDLIKEQKNAL